MTAGWRPSLSLRAGESESDEEDLPPSYRNKNKQKKGKKAEEQPAAAAAAEEEEGTSDPGTAGPSSEPGAAGRSNTCASSSDPDAAVVAEEGESVGIPDAPEGHASAIPPTPPPDFKAELEGRAIARAAARAEAADALYTEAASPVGPSGGAGGSSGASAALAAGAGEDREAVAEALVRAAGRPSSARAPKVWGTAAYRQLWKMAVQAGEEQAAQQEGEEEEEGDVQVAGEDGAGTGPSLSNGRVTEAPFPVTVSAPAPVARSRNALEVWPAAAVGDDSADAPMTTASPEDEPGTADAPLAAAALTASAASLMEVASAQHRALVAVADSAQSEPDLDSAQSHAGGPNAALPVSLGC